MYEPDRVVTELTGWIGDRFEPPAGVPADAMGRGSHDAGAPGSWRQQRRLRASLDRSKHRDERNDGLAVADIALQKPHHALRPRHVGGDLEMA